MTTISRPAGSALIEETTARVRREYGGAIGHHRSELVTPALVLDLAAAQRNIDQMAARIRELPAEIRPHIKVHKSPELGRRQMDAGAIGLCTATVWEAMVLVRGRDRPPLRGQHRRRAGQDGGPGRARPRARHHGRRRRRGQRRRALGSGRRGRQRRWRSSIEVDTGMDRAGVDDGDAALALARACERPNGLRLDGLTGYEGPLLAHLRSETCATREQREAMALFAGVADRLIAGRLPRARSCSAGGTGDVGMDRRVSAAHRDPGRHVRRHGHFHGAMVARLRTFPDRPGDGHQPAPRPGHRRCRQQVDGRRRPGHDRRPSTSASFRFDEEHGIFDATNGSPLKVGDVGRPGAGLLARHGQLVRRLPRRQGRRGGRHLARHPARPGPSRPGQRLSTPAPRRAGEESTP